MSEPTEAPTKQGMPAAFYPSGVRMPPYGPTTDDQVIHDALEWAYEVLLRRDEMNAAVHCTPVRYSPVTVKVRNAIGTWYTRVGALAPGFNDPGAS